MVNIYSECGKCKNEKFCNFKNENFDNIKKVLAIIPKDDDVDVFKIDLYCNYFRNKQEQTIRSPEGGF
jgi:uncharacterized protein (DUF1697 family)